MPATGWFGRPTNRGRIRGHHRSVAVETFPVTAEAPARAKPGHESVPAARLHAQRHLVADRAPISIGKDEEEHDRCHDDAQHEESDEDDSEYHGRHIRCQAFRRVFMNPRAARTVPFKEARVGVRSCSTVPPTQPHPRFARWRSPSRFRWAAHRGCGRERGARLLRAGS